MASLSAQCLQKSKRIVIKIGSALLVEEGRLRRKWLEALAHDIARLKKNGADVILVSSGSIALGRGILNLPHSEMTLEKSQAAASVGQIRLARAYQEALEPFAITTSQILLTLEDTEDRKRYLNARATLNALLNLGVVPIVNENDTVATDEIRYGDNDRLAAQISVTTGADLLILLSDVDGIYTANPSIDPTAQHLPIIDKITPEIEAMAGDPVSGLSKGGMKTKIMAAKIATTGGCAMLIAHGAALQPIKALFDGASSSLFLAEHDPEKARKRWIGAMKPKGKIIIDQGAKGALSKGKSLLPAGVLFVDGEFERGDPVELVDSQGYSIAIGLTRYTAQEVHEIKGVHSDKIKEILGYQGRAALIHRDDLVG